MPLTLCLGYLYLIPRYYSTYKDDRKMEFEADSEAIVLMTRAGFNPKGAYTSLEFIGKLPTKYTASSTHPKTEKRIENVANTISKINTDTLKNQGIQNLYNSEVLEPLISSDDKSIIISSGANKKNYEYIKNSSNSNYIFEAYRNYIKNDYNKAADLFEKAYESNKKDYIAPLYLSLIYEEEYNRTKNTDFLKKANNYAKKAKKNAPANINVIKQYNDIKAELKSVK